jgi:peptide/nickel transport system substrate-binding protein
LKAKRRIVGGILLALVGTSAACAPQERPAQTVTPGFQRTAAAPSTSPAPTEAPTETPTPTPSPVTLEVGWEGDLVDCLNFAICHEGKRVWDLLYDSLIGWDAVGEEGIAPRLAESWEAPPGAMKITFQLRDLEGATFHDGTPLTAQDVAWSINYYAGNAALAWILGTSVGPGFGAQAIDAETVELQLIEPINSEVLLGYLTNLYVLPSEVWSVYDEATIEDFPNHDPIGSGPYRLADWVPGEYMILEAHAGSPMGKPPIDRLVVRIYPDSASMIEGLLAGEVDLLSSLSPMQITSIRDAPGVELYEKAPINGYWLAFNRWEKGGGDPAVSDREVREAIAHAIDRDGLLESVAGGEGRVPGSLWDGGERFDEWANSDLSPYEYDPGLAAELLDAAGYGDDDEDGIREAGGNVDDPLRLRLSYSTELPEAERIAEGIAEGLREIGVGVELVGQASTELRQRMLSADFDLAIDRIDLSRDPDLSLYTMTSWALDAGANAVGYSNIELDSMYLAQHYAAGHAERREYVRAAQRILHDDLPWLPLYFFSAYDAVREDRFDLTITDTFDEVWGWYGIWGVVPIQTPIGSGE